MATTDPDSGADHAGPEGFAFDVETKFQMKFKNATADEHGTDVAAYDAMDDLFRVVKHTLARFVIVADALGYDDEDVWAALDDRAYDTVHETMVMVDELRDEMRRMDDEDDDDDGVPVGFA